MTKIIILKVENYSIKLKKDLINYQSLNYCRS